MARNETNAVAHWPAWVRAGVELRRELHRLPELRWEERATAARVRRELDRLGMAWRECAGTGTVATLAPGASGEHVALRADIDGLPILERGEAPWRSEVDGCMHACGHDGHTATLILTAQWLKAHEAALPGPVTLLFQPAEEGGHGAKRMIADGALDGVDVIFGWHNWPSAPLGEAICPDGTVMAGNGEFEIIVKGKGGHASQPEACRDPVLAGSAIVMALQQIVSRRVPPQPPTVVSVTSFDARSGLTIIPDTAQLAGSIRIARPEQRAPLAALITDIAQQTARAYGAEADVTVRPRYDPTINHPAQASRYRDALAAEFGDYAKNTATAPTSMASEDFSYYLAAIPGAFALVGANADADPAPLLHNDRYDFNDALIPRMVRVFASLAGAPAPPNHALAD